jgi:hypothetical protein
MIKNKIHKKPRIIFLGATPFGDVKGRIKRYAERFKQFNFIEINKMDVKSNQKNVFIKRKDWLEGLKTEKNNSIGNIKSGMSLGYYGPATNALTYSTKSQSQRSQIVRYTRSILLLAHKKLKKNCAISIIVAGEKKNGQNHFPTNGLENIKASLIDTPFENTHTIKKISKKEMPFLDKYELEAMKSGMPLYRILLIKK